MRALRDRLENDILADITKRDSNGAKEPRLPNTSNVAFDFVEAEGVLMLLDQPESAPPADRLHDRFARTRPMF